MSNQNISKLEFYVSWIMSGLVIIFLLFDAIMKFLKPHQVVETIDKLGFQDHQIYSIGLIGLVGTILYAIPRTSVLGAIILTAFLGGAIAANFRVDMPLFTHKLFPVYIAVLMWGGLWLRNDEVRDTLPFTME